MYMRMTTLVVLVLALVVFTSTAALASRLVDVTQGNCQVWIPDDVAGVTATWDGVCQNKLADGRGTLMVKLGNNVLLSYVGEMSNGYYSGQGKLTQNDGSIAEGRWVNALLEGAGTMIWPGLGRYEGIFVHSAAGGQGTYVSGAGDTYKGEWKNNMKEGQGQIIWAIGDIYEGGWINDHMQGTGVYRWANGDRYEGDWADGLMTGTGVYHWTDGSRYEGNWLKGDIRGRGTYTKSDGSLYEGAVYNGRYAGGTLVQAQVLNPMLTQPRSDLNGNDEEASMNKVYAEKSTYDKTVDKVKGWIERKVETRRGQGSGAVRG